MRTLSGYEIARTGHIDCPYCKGVGTLAIDYDASGCARWGRCRSCQGDGPVSPCQECKRDPKPCEKT